MCVRANARSEHAGVSRLIFDRREWVFIVCGCVVSDSNGGGRVMTNF